MTVPSPRQRDVLVTIARHQARHGAPPTVRELGEILGIRSAYGVVCHLAALERKGLIKRRPLKARNLRITGAGRVAIQDEHWCSRCGQEIAA